MPDSPCGQAATRAHWGAGTHSGWENGQSPPNPRRPSKAPRTKTLGPTLPLPSALTLDRPSTCRTAMHLGLSSSWGLSLTLGRPPRGPSKGTWCHKAGDWGPPSPSARLTLPIGCHTSPSGATAHSWREYGHGPLSPRQPSKAPRAKTLRPSSSSPGPLPQPAPPLPKKPLPWACRPPGG